MPVVGHLHREGLVDQRRDRPAPARQHLVLLLRPDTVVVASVSCIYGLGSPEEYRDRIVALRPGEVHEQRSLLSATGRAPVHAQRHDPVTGAVPGPGRHGRDPRRLREQAVRIEFFGDTVERIRPFDVTTGEIGDELDELVVFANTHYGAGDERMQTALVGIEAELRQRLAELTEAGKLLEAQRLRMRTEYDLEMLAETGVCSGIENYSRHLDGRAPGEAPFTLLDFFPKDFLVVVDESHVAVPQLRGQFAGDRSRKETLVDHGFRLPSALDNRPLRFEEFVERTGQAILLSATPGPWELEHSAKSSSRSSVPPAWSTRRWTSARPPARSTTCASASTPRWPTATGS